VGIAGRTTLASFQAPNRSALFHYYEQAAAHYPRCSGTRPEIYCSNRPLTFAFLDLIPPQMTISGVQLLVYSRDGHADRNLLRFPSCPRSRFRAFDIFCLT